MRRHGVELTTGPVLRAKEKEAEKNGKKNRMRKTEAEAKLKEEAGKPVTETGGPVESVTEVGKSVTEASKAAAKKSDASNVLQAVTVFEDAEYFDSELQSYWDRLFGHHSEETTHFPPPMRNTHAGFIRGSYADEVKARDTLARGRSLLDSQEQLANKNEKKNGKKAKAEAKLKDEEAGKAEASVTEARKPEGSVTQAGKAEAFVTEAGKPEESVTQAGKADTSVAETRRHVESVTEVGKPLTEASKAAADKSDASNVLQAVKVFAYAEDFGADFQSFWERCFSLYCAYDETTTIPAMCYTHASDADEVEAMDTLQVVSVKVASIVEGLHWPLEVFGMVSARDVVDRKRNIIFHRERDNCQLITEQDPYLTLTGPSRAVVVSFDPSYIEVVLKVKGTTESEDKELSRLAVCYRLSNMINGLYPCELSMLELTFSEVYSSVEATVHLKVTGGSWPDGFKGVFSAATARTESAKVRLLCFGDDGLPVDAADGTVRLSRRVVSVELRGMLKVFVSACSPADDEEHCEASFVPRKAGVSPGVELKIGSCRMEATVAWSLFQSYY